MEFLIISGVPNTGKTTAIHRIAEWITKGKISRDINGNVLPPFYMKTPNSKGRLVYEDFSVVVNVSSKKIIIHTATDDTVNIDKLKDLINNHKDADIVITSCRDIGKERDYFCDKIIDIEKVANITEENGNSCLCSNDYIEVPLGKITRRGMNRRKVMNWYEVKVFCLNKHLLENPPFNL